MKTKEILTNGGWGDDCEDYRPSSEIDLEEEILDYKGKKSKPWQDGDNNG